MEKEEKEKTPGEIEEEEREARIQRRIEENREKEAKANAERVQKEEKLKKIKIGLVIFFFVLLIYALIAVTVLLATGSGHSAKSLSPVSSGQDHAVPSGRFDMILIRANRPLSLSNDGDVIEIFHNVAEFEKAHPKLEVIGRQVLIENGKIEGVVLSVSKPIAEKNSNGN